jgi:hypothetical protein
MSENVFLQQGEVYAVIKEQLGTSCDVEKYFARYFKQYGGGYIPLIDIDMIKFFSEPAALKIIEQKLGFPKPRAHYLETYFFCEDGRYIPRVNFDHLKRTVVDQDLVRKMSTVIDLERTDPRRQAVLMEIYTAVRSHWIDVVHG